MRFNILLSFSLFFFSISLPTPPTNEVSSRRLVYTRTYGYAALYVVYVVVNDDFTLSQQLTSKYGHNRSPICCALSGVQQQREESKNFEKYSIVYGFLKKKASATNTNEFFSSLLTLFVEENFFFMLHTIYIFFSRGSRGLRGVYDSRVSVSSEAVEDSRSKGIHHVFVSSRYRKNKIENLRKILRR